MGEKVKKNGEEMILHSIKKETIYIAIKELNQEGYPIFTLCKFAGIATSSYYKWLNKTINLKRVYRLMKTSNLHAVIRKKKKKDLAISNNPTVKPLFHSDRGFQYTHKAFKAKLDKQEPVQSMSRVPRCIDNGPMEGFWGIIKSEMYYLNKFHTFEELKLAIDNYIKFYNEKSDVSIIA